MSQENVNTIRNLYDLFARGDVPTVLAGFHPEIEWNEAENFPYADGNPYRGPNGVLEGVFARILVDFESFAATPETFLDAGASVVALGRYTGTNKATGHAIHAQFAHIWWLDGGKITRFQQYTDTLQAARATGA